tara:strand:+ start:402 stop:716 length:315 start_codon:yes stop_codon:yes gene_type:complete
LGRIQRIALAEDTPVRIDLAMVRPGKLLLKNVSTTNDIRVGYMLLGGIGDGAGLAGAQNFYSLGAGNEYVFDCGPGVGVLAQDQQLYFGVTGGTAVIEVWIANS